MKSCAERIKCPELREPEIRQEATSATAVNRKGCGPAHPVLSARSFLQHVTAEARPYRLRLGFQLFFDITDSEVDEGPNTCRQ